MSDKTRTARLLYGATGKLTEDARAEAEYFFGRSEVLKEEVKRAVSFGGDEQLGRDPVSRW